MSTNPFNSIVELYTESVKKADSIGLSEVYKQATEVIFEGLKERLPFDINITGVEYLDGYFIFGHGTNSVVHFHIEETPGWKYGLWWSPVPKSEDEDDEANQEYYTDRLRGELFAQYEEEIDKFKPSASMVSETFTLYLPAPASNLTWGFAEDIKFIHDEPYLAFYREMHYTDFNREYVSRAKAKAYFERHYKQKKLEEETKALNDKEMLKTVYEILKEDIDEGTCFVVDRGDSWSPRYEIIIKNAWEVEDGCYGLFDLFEEADAEATRKFCDKTIKDCEKRAKKADCCWYSTSCCHESVNLFSAEKYEDFIEHAKKVDFTDIGETTNETNS
jgi:hypothetical protein